MTAHSVAISDSVDLTYAIVGSSLVVASDPAAVDQLVRGKGGLDAEDLFGRATAGLPDELSMLAYLNLGGLVALGEQSGPGRGPCLRDLRARGPQAAGARPGGPIELADELSTDARLVVGGGPRRGRRRCGRAPTD